MHNDKAAILNQEVSTIIDAIQKIQSRIAGTGEPPSQLELHELQRLGRHYGNLIEQLISLQDTSK